LLDSVARQHCTYHCSELHLSLLSIALSIAKHCKINISSVLFSLYSKAPSYTAPRCMDPADTLFFLGPTFFQIHSFPNVGHSFTPQLHRYELGPIIKKVTRFLSYTVFQNTLRQALLYCNLF
jgi:hypothetical protein